MEINNIARNSQTQVSMEKKVQEKRDFSQSFSDAKQRRSDQEFKKMINDIKNKGNKLVLTKCYSDVRAYKRMIKEYLAEVLENMYKVKNNTSFWQTQYFVTIEIIDEKLEELTNSLLVDEKENISVAATVDEIQGMIVDIYR
ncbi:MAG: YaaR family protein [Sarcina sp.]